MKTNVLQSVIAFVFKYIWIICAILILLEIISVSYTTVVLVEETSESNMESVSGEVSGRVDGVLKLLNGLAKDERIIDTSQTLFDRVQYAKPYKENFDLFMIALTDENINVVSTNDEKPPTADFNLALYDYMQRIYATGIPEITDTFLAGTDGNTKNFTIVVPIFENDVVVGTVFGAINFKDFENIVSRNMKDGSNEMLLLGSDLVAMTSSNEKFTGKNINEIIQHSIFIGTDEFSITQNVQTGKSCSFWEFSSKGPIYITHENVIHTPWILVYRVHFFSVFATLIPVLVAKIAFYIALSVFIYKFGKSYMTKHLTSVNRLITQLVSIQKELFQSEQTDYENLLEFSQMALSDQLTGLATRAVLFKKMTDILETKGAHGAVIFLDLDDLKRINDNFSHEGGDSALIKFTSVLKDYEKKYNGIAARYGGDEFIFVLNNYNKKESISIAQALCKDLNISISVATSNFTIHGSLGVAFYPEHGIRPEDLICKADLALYEAKHMGKNIFSVYSDSISL